MTEEKKRPTVKSLMDELDARFPFRLAAEWDNVGLLTGRFEASVSKAIVTLDLTPQVLEEAFDRGVDLILSHHPPFLDPFKKINDSSPSGALVLALCERGVSLISAHTNVDLSPDGVSAWLAKRLGAVELFPLEEVGREEKYKLVVFTPPDSVPDVLSAAFSAGAGVIGNYSMCSFRCRGVGSFYPEEKASPKVGVKGLFQEVEEDRVEVVLPKTVLDEVIRKVREAHPYEEAAIDVYPLEVRKPAGWLGVSFRLDEPITFREFLDRAADEVRPANLRYAGDEGRIVRKIAVLAGSGGGFVGKVLKTDADVFVSGDLKHHQVHDLVHAGKAVVDLGHYDSEKFFIWEMAEFLEERFGDSIEVIRYEGSTEYVRTWCRMEESDI